MSPFASCFAFSYRQQVLRFSCPPPSSQREPYRQGLCPQWWASSQQLWEAFYMKLGRRFSGDMKIIMRVTRAERVVKDNFVVMWMTVEVGRKKSGRRGNLYSLAGVVICLARCGRREFKRAEKPGKERKEFRLSRRAGCSPY